MIDKLLTTFTGNSHVTADIGEKIGNLGLALLRIGFGKTVNVEKIPKNKDVTAFTENMYSTSVRVAVVILSIIVFPLTILFAAIGCLGTVYSKSHEQIFNAYTEFKALKSAAKIENVQSKEGDKTSSQDRRIPPLALCDTLVFSPTGIKSVHGSGELFSDDEIVEKMDLLKSVEIGSNIYATYTKYGKAIIQQQATRGCTAAVAAMLIMDNGKVPDMTALLYRNLGDDRDQQQDFQNAGLTAVTNPAHNLSQLQKLIVQKGSAIVSLSGKLASHVIIVDEVSEDHSIIRLRDPYHGWEITVTNEAFLKEWAPGSVMQIEKG